jgi:hypothetical protein
MSNTTARMNNNFLILYSMTIPPQYFVINIIANIKHYIHAIKKRRGCVMEDEEGISNYNGSVIYINRMLVSTSV